MRGIKGYFSQHKTGSTLAGFLIIAFVFLMTTSDSASFSPKQAGVAIFSVIQRGIAGVGGFFGRLVTSIGELNRLKSKYQSLQDQLHSYNLSEREIAQLRQEIARLKEQLEFSETIDQRFIAAEIIGKDAGDFLTGFLINKGRVHGISRNMPVVAYNNGLEGLVGRVFTVGPVSALVLPLFDTTCYVPGRVMSARYTGLVNGQGDSLGHLTMTAVPKSARGTLKVGDLIVTSGLSTLYPKDVYIGRIREIGAKPWESSLVIEVEPTVDFSRLEYVYALDLAE